MGLSTKELKEKGKMREETQTVKPLSPTTVDDGSEFISPSGSVSEKSGRENTASDKQRHLQVDQISEESHSHTSFGLSPKSVV